MNLPTMHRMIRIPAALAANARELLRVLSDPGTCEGMFTAGYNATGLGPATHFISSGLIDPDVAGIISKVPANIFAAYVAAGGTVLTLADVQALVANVDIRNNTYGVESTVLNLAGMKATAG